MNKNQRTTSRNQREDLTSNKKCSGLRGSNFDSTNDKISASFSGISKEDLNIKNKSMTKKLLTDLNGNKTGELKKFIDNFKGEPRIAWYPSAGTDFRALFFLHPSFSQQHRASEAEPQVPDIFLFTDYFPWKEHTFMNNEIIYSDDRTTVIIEHLEELPRLNLPLHEQIIHYHRGSSKTDRAVFLKIRIESNRLGSFSFPVVYAFAENEAFYCNKLVPNEATISHIIHVRYGGGYGGGGSANGAWLLNVLKKLNTELFITDGHHEWQSGDDFALRICPSIPKYSDVELKSIRTVPSESWSMHGDVSWNLVSLCRRQ